MPHWVGVEKRHRRTDDVENVRKQHDDENGKEEVAHSSRPAGDRSPAGSTRHAGSWPDPMVYRARYRGRRFLSSYLGEREHQPTRPQIRLKRLCFRDPENILENRTAILYFIEYKRIGQNFAAISFALTESFGADVALPT